MPLNSAQLAALVERARHKTPPVVIPSPPPAPSTVRPPRSVRRPVALAPQSPLSAPPAPIQNTAADAEARGRCANGIPAITSVTCAAARTCRRGRGFPNRVGVTKESWHFHRRFYRVFRRPMALGEYCICSGRSDVAGLSTSARTAGASRCPTAGARWLSVPTDGSCSLSCRRTGSRFHQDEARHR
jgi:hypothetical protein